MNNFRKNKKYSLQDNARLEGYLKTPQFLDETKETIKHVTTDDLPLSAGLRVDIALTQGIWIDQNDYIMI